MKIEVVPGRALATDLLTSWTRILDADPRLTSPYFTPAFTAHVASVRDDVHVGIASDSSGVRGILPFQRGALGVGRPVGGALSDYQAFIVEPGFEYDPRELVRGCRLASLRYDHLLAHQVAFEPFHTSRAESPVMDLSGGYEAYVEARKAAGSQEIRNLPRKARKLEREVGSLRFEVRSTSAADMSTLRAWKSAQCLAVGGADVFEAPWVRALMDRIWHDSGERFEGLFSTLHAGETLVAAHFGMRSRTVWHWWFPVYSHEHSPYSPGIVLLMKMAEVAGTMGLTVIDFGKGDNEYKQRMKTGSIPLAEGVVDLPSAASALGRARRWAERTAGAGGLGTALKLPLKVLRKFENRGKFD